MVPQESFKQIYLSFSLSEVATVAHPYSTRHSPRPVRASARCSLSAVRLVSRLLDCRWSRHAPDSLPAARPGPPFLASHSSLPAQIFCPALARQPSPAARPAGGFLSTASPALSRASSPAARPVPYRPGTRPEIPCPSCS